MRRSLVALMMVALLAAGIASLFHALTASAQGLPGGPDGPPRKFEWDATRAAATLAHMLEDIKGREDMPAESVYKNIKILKGMPARRVPAIMVMSFQRSVGMDCQGCHVRGDMASDEKPNKRVARDMWAMTQDLNKRVLPAIKDLEDDTPVVNCWTCHRGQREPQSNPDSTRAAAAPAEAPKPEPSH